MEMTTVETRLNFDRIGGITMYRFHSNNIGFVHMRYWCGSRSRREYSKIVPIDT
jgi:hypothetical protein